MQDLEKGPTPPSLYDWAGGKAAIDRLMTVFYRKVFADSLLQPVFAQMGPNHPQYVSAFIGEVFGGPDDYSRHHGGHAGMITKHLGKHLNELQRRRWMELLVDAAAEAGLPGDPEFRSAFIAYIEWGTRLAVINSQPGQSAPAASSPMPKWGWGEVGGPYKG